MPESLEMKPARRSDERTVASIRYIGEQDGAPERLLQSRLCDVSHAAMESSSSTLSAASNTVR
jgi:hypothetical protein